MQSLYQYLKRPSWPLPPPPTTLLHHRPSHTAPAGPKTFPSPQSPGPGPSPSTHAELCKPRTGQIPAHSPAQTSVSTRNTPYTIEESAPRTSSAAPAPRQTRTGARPRKSGAGGRARTPRGRTPRGWRRRAAGSAPPSPWGTRRRRSSPGPGRTRSSGRWPCGRRWCWRIRGPAGRCWCKVVCCTCKWRVVV